MDKVISFGKGIRRQPSIGDAGELSELVNLIPKNGELVNVAPIKQKSTIAGGHTLLCEHSVNGKYITMSGNTIYLGEQTIAVKNFKTISTIGNIVVVNDDNGQQYAMWNGTEYTLFNDTNFSFNIHIDNASSKLGAKFVGASSNDEQTFNDVDAAINQVISDDTEWFKYVTFGVAVLRFYDGSIAAATDIFTLDNIVAKSGMYVENGSTLYGLSKYRATISNSIPNDIKQLLRSVDIYLSTSRHLAYHHKDNTGGSFPSLSSIDMSKEIANMTFHLSASIDIMELKSQYTMLLTRVTGAEEELEYHSSSITPSPSISFVYNSSLNIADIAYKQKKSLAERMQSVYIGTAKYNDTDQKIYGYYGQIPDTSMEGTLDDLKSSRMVSCCVEVEIVEDNVHDVIRMIYEEINYPFPPIFSFPNRNAKKATIYLKRSVGDENFAEGGKYLKRTIELTPSSVGNFAFHIENDVKYIQAYSIKSYGEDLDYKRNDGWEELNTAGGFNDVVAKGESYTISRNGKNIIKKSNVNNPFVFEDINTVSVGSGEIKGVSTSAKALSQGQFGQFPLYAFCTDGIWALEVAQDGSYSAKQPISRDVCNNADSITQVDGAVVFTTDQGLKLIQGSEVVLLSGQMDGHNVDENNYFPEGFFAGHGLEKYDKLVTPPVTDDFRTILATSKIAYDYPNRLLRIYPNSGKKWYVYSLEAQEFSSEEPLDGGVKAVVAGYPTSLIQVGGGLYTFRNEVSDDMRDGLLLTRPIDMGEPFAMKKLHDMRTLYTKYSDSTFVRVVIFVSNDGVHWAVLPSLRRGSFKYYRLAMITRMTDADRLSGTVMRYTVERNNKLR